MPFFFNVLLLGADLLVPTIEFYVHIRAAKGTLCEYLYFLIPLYVIFPIEESNSLLIPKSVFASSLIVKLLYVQKEENDNLG